MVTQENNFFARIKGVLTFDDITYEQIGNDKAASKQAVVIIILSAVILTIANWSENEGEALGAGLGTIMWWLLLSSFVHVFGIMFSQKSSAHLSFGRTLRLMGFAHAPFIFMLVALIPGVGVLVPYVVGFWFLPTLFYSIREATYLSTGLTCLEILLLYIGIIAMLIYAGYQLI